MHEEKSLRCGGVYHEMKCAQLLILILTYYKLVMI